ncbi:MAG: UDP-N-acetylmuramoyl-L-alanine--D-glutamate ligase [Brevinema sp.]
MILILGFTNRTSFSLAKYLLKNNTIVAADRISNPEKKALLAELRCYGEVLDELGNQDISLLDKYHITQIFLSPGVPRSIPIIQDALRRGVEVLNDIEFFYRTFPHRKYIAITGTDGKTTVTTWLGDVVSREQKIVLAGNIGTPIFDFSNEEYQNHIFIIELSSFQLESISTFHPQITLLTNISEDHIDRYSGMAEYALTKKNIFKNQTHSDLALLNAEDQLSVLDPILYPVSKKYFSYCQKSDCFYDNGFIYYGDECFFDLSCLKVKGKHNILNALLIVLAAKALNISDDSIKKSLEEFQGVSHRLQYIGTYEGISFYNDSKATTPQAMRLALESFDKPLILVAGGQSKGASFEELKILVHRSTKKIFLFGEMANYFQQTWNKGVVYPTMREAVFEAMNAAEEGDVILLSPGGASFDEYESYVDRGLNFIQIVTDHYRQK